MHRSGDFREGDVAVGELDLLQEAQGASQPGMAGQVLEEAPEVAGRGTGRAGRGIAQLIASLRRNADRGEEVLRRQPSGGRAQAEQRAGGQARLEPLRAQHRPALSIGKVDVLQLEAQGMGGPEPGDRHGAHPGAAAGRGGGQPALGHGAKGARVDLPLRKPPSGEACDEDEPRQDAQDGRRDVSDGWPQHAGNPLPRTQSAGHAWLCDLAERPS